MSNSGDWNGMYYGFPMSPALDVKAQAGTAADMFVFTVWVKPVGASGDGSNVEIDLGTGDDRVNFMAITNMPDDQSGLHLRIGNCWTETVVTIPDRTVWHRIDVAATFRVGSNNDTYTVSLDGQGLGTFKTIETYFEWRGDLDADAKTVDRVFFRSNSNVDEWIPGGAGAGFYFDDLAYSSRSSADTSARIAEYETSFNHGGTPEHFNPEDYSRPLTRKEQRALLKEQRRELAFHLMETEGYRWRKAWRTAGRMMAAGAQT